MLIVACVLGCLAAGGVSGGAAPVDAWYDQLRKPPWTPPGWVFGMTWSVLYAVMGLALGIVLGRGWHTAGVKHAAALFGIQLALNVAWSPVFFRLHTPGGALALILVLWAMLAWTVAAFWSVRDVAGALLLPYWLWVTFAVALNASIWRMN